MLLSLPEAMVTADGMDARTQLIESWMSPRTTEASSSWIRRYLPGTRQALEAWAGGDPARRYLRVMQNAAFVSGVVLARTGLGAVHGLAAALGALCGVKDLIAFASRAFTLLPGDVLITGTPHGVGVGRTPPVFLKDGDTIAIEVEGLGTLTNPCQEENV